MKLGSMGFQIVSWQDCIYDFIFNIGRSELSRQTDPRLISSLSKQMYFPAGWRKDYKGIVNREIYKHDLK